MLHRGGEGERARPVLVYFETKWRVKMSLALREPKGVLRDMRVEDAAADRKHAVRRAVASKSVALLSHDFGHDTDIVCSDDILLMAGYM
jgi:hypothetical protein